MTITHSTVLVHKQWCAYINEHYNVWTVSQCTCTCITIIIVIMYAIPSNQDAELSTPSYHSELYTLCIRKFPNYYRLYSEYTLCIRKFPNYYRLYSEISELYTLCIRKFPNYYRLYSEIILYTMYSEISELL